MQATAAASQVYLLVLQGPDPISSDVRLSRMPYLAIVNEAQTAWQIRPHRPLLAVGRSEFPPPPYRQ